MHPNYEIKSQNKNKNAKPNVASYDSGYEHSMEHWVALRLMVEEFEEEATIIEESRELISA